MSGSGCGVDCDHHEDERALKALVGDGHVPGLVGYEDDIPVGWVSLSPREDYAKLRRSPAMKPVDDKRVWSIVCFFVDKGARGKECPRPS